MKNLVLIVCLIFSVSLFGQEYSIQQVPNPKTTNSRAYVSNPDGILKSETVDELNTITVLIKKQNRLIANIQEALAGERRVR